MSSKKAVSLIYFDSFGREVADRLEKLLADSRNVVRRQLVCESTTGIECNSDMLHVVIAGQPVHKLCLEIDDSCHRTGAEFFPAVIGESGLCIGPFIKPSHSPCWECWDERFTSQHPYPVERRLLLEHYDKVQSERVRAYMPYTVAIAAARAAEEIAFNRSSQVSASAVWLMNIFTRNASSAYYVGRHGCKKCGSQECEMDRSIRNLQAYVRSEEASTARATQSINKL